MPVDPSTRRHLDDHLGQAQFALQVAANFDCVKGTPAHASVRAALAQVERARRWVREKLEVDVALKPKVPPMPEEPGLTRREIHRAAYRRMHL